ncbi:hypothetical protein RRG08_002786 [Elysia crispata]|uniref:Uncharacterized protein n=1 Tax=Elysia crispata TaxID=231223 RepID=A0AAE0XUI7_9GAST|nr:hypothetical protein RRG08_002786 [Elysia crispata]
MRQMRDSRRLTQATTVATVGSDITQNIHKPREAVCSRCLSLVDHASDERLTETHPGDHCGHGRRQT